MIRFQKHCGKLFINAKNNFIFILEVFSALSKQRYIATVAKIMTHFSLIQVKFSAVYPAFMDVTMHVSPFSYKIEACQIFVKTFSAKNKQIFEFGLVQPGPKSRAKVTIKSQINRRIKVWTPVKCTL